MYADQKEFDRIRHLLEDGESYTRNVVDDEIFSIHLLSKIISVLSSVLSSYNSASTPLKSLSALIL